jgi:hypothetical protein
VHVRTLPRHRSRLHRPWALWLALCVALSGAAAPTVLRTLAATGARATVEICTAAGGVQGLAQPSSDSSGEVSSTQAPALSPDHCPFCLLVAERLGPPPAASMHFFNTESGLAPPDAQALFFVSEALAATLPRGPPRHA